MKASRHRNIASVHVAENSVGVSTRFEDQPIEVADLGVPEMTGRGRYPGSGIAWLVEVTRRHGNFRLLRELLNKMEAGWPRTL